MRGTHLLLLAFSVGAAVADCPDSFALLGQYCYYFSDQALSWHSAREACKSLSIANIPVDLAVFDLFPGDYRLLFHHATLLGNDSWWVGGTEEGHPGYWVWIDGRPVDLVKAYWRPDEPDLVDDQNVLMITYQSDEKYPRRRLGDWIAERSHKYICQLGVTGVI